MISSTTTVRVNLETQEFLRTLAQQDNDSIQAVLDRAVKDYGGVACWKPATLHTRNCVPIRRLGRRN